MKLLLTSGGVTNQSIRAELVKLLGKPIEESTALFIPTAQWGQPACSPESVYKSIANKWDGSESLTNLGWKSVGVLELTALPSIGKERWAAWVQNVDALLVDGGEAIYLAKWLRESGLADMFPQLNNTVWVGVSAGSMALTPRIGKEFCDWQPDGTDETLGLVDFSIFPHLDYPGWSSNTLDSARRWAETLGAPAYAIDEQTAIAVVGDSVEVISDGQWHLFNEAT